MISSQGVPRLGHRSAAAAAAPGPPRRGITLPYRSLIMVLLRCPMHFASAVAGTPAATIMEMDCLRSSWL